MEGDMTTTGLRQTGESVADNSDVIREQFALEKRWREKILASKRGPERTEHIKQAYKEVSALIETYRPYHEDLVAKAKKQFAMLSTLFGEERIRFLDVGCSSGALVFEALSHGWDAYGVDIEEASTELAQRKMQTLFPGDGKDRFFFGEIYDVTENEFDLVYHSDVLEHIHPDEVVDFLARMHSLLVSGGRLVVSTPYRLSGPKDVSRFFVPTGEAAQGLHLKEYLLSEMIRLLETAGFREVHSFLLHPSLYPAANRAIGAGRLNTFLKRGIETAFLLLPRPLGRRVYGPVSTRLSFSISIGLK